MGAARHAPGQIQHILYGDVEAVALQLFDLLDFLVDPAVDHLLQHGLQVGIVVADAITEDVDVQKILVRSAGCGVFQGRDHPHAVGGPGGQGFIHAQDAVVIRQGHHPDAQAGGVGHQFGGRFCAVRAGGVGLQVDGIG